MSYEVQRLYPSKRTTPISLYEGLAVLFIAHNQLPIVGYYMPSVVYLGLFGLLLMLGVRAFVLKKTYTAMGMFAVSVLECISMLLSEQSIMTTAVYVYGQLQSFLYAIIALSLIRQQDPGTCKRMFTIIILMYTVTAISTIWGNMEYPQASRLLATLDNDDVLNQLYTSKNIGGFSFAYSMVLIVPLLVYLIRNKLIKPVIGYPLLGLFGGTVLVMEYATAVLLYFSSIGLLFIPRITTKKLLVLLLVILLLFTLAGSFMADIFEWIAEALDSNTLADRFLGVADSLRGQDSISSESGSNRVELYTKSLQTFLDTSLLGSWDKSGVGGHSFVLDAMGNYGLLGLIAVIMVLVCQYGLSLKPFRKQACYPYLLWSYLQCVLLMAINPHVYWFTFLCVLPLFTAMLPNQEGTGETQPNIQRKTGL